MGILGRITNFVSRRSQGGPHIALKKNRKWGVESLEPRQLLAADLLHVGSVYFEEATGDDSQADVIEVSYEGGAVGTQMTRLVIDGDKKGNGQLEGDVFFDIADGGMGAFEAVGLTIVSQDGFDITGISVVDGGSQIVLDFSGFDAGEKLVFSLDVDEISFIENDGSIDATSVVEGGEFQRSKLTAEFVAPHYHDVTIGATYWDAFDDDFQAAATLAGSTLDLHNDAYDSGHDLSDRTAGAVGTGLQTPLPIQISGTVFVDMDLDNQQDPGDDGLAGVTLSLWKYDSATDTYVNTGRAETTDSQGDYAFTSDSDAILPGRYEIRETQPTDYFSVGATAGTVNGTTEGAVLNADTISQVDLLGGQHSVDNDFAEALPASLSGHVYHDADNDGVREPGEDGIENVVIQVIPINTLTGSTAVIEITTDASGYWEATGLAPGEYRVVEPVQPLPYLDGLDAAGTVSGVVVGSAVNPGDRINSVTLKGGDAGVDYDFGEVLPSSISGQVHASTDGDCEIDAESILLEGVQIDLLDASGNLLDTTFTDSEGRYTFDRLMPGEYQVVEHQPSAYFDGDEHVGSAGGNILANDKVSNIVLTAGTTAVEYNFCEHVGVNLSGYVYHDANDDGVFDPSEDGIGGVTVELLDENGNGTGKFATTSSAPGEVGYYQFTNLAAGVYGVAESQPSGWLDGKDTAGNRGGTANSNEDWIRGATLPWGHDGEHYNFGELLPSSISGIVHASTDEDCIVGENDLLLEGVQIDLLDPAGNVLATTFTDASGEYRFENLAPGEYQIFEHQPSEYFDGDEHVGSAGGMLGGPSPAELTVDAAFSGGVAMVEATGVSGYAPEVVATQVNADGILTLENGSIQLFATDGGALEGSAGNSVQIHIVESATAQGTVSTNRVGNQITIAVSNSGVTIQQIADQLTADAVALSLTVGVVTNGASVLDGTAEGDGSDDITTFSSVLTGGADAVTGTDILTVVSNGGAGASVNGLTVTFVETSMQPSSTAFAAFENNGNIVVSLNNQVGTVSFTSIADAIQRLNGFTALVSGNGDGQYQTGFGNTGLQITIGDGSNGGVVGVDLTHFLAEDVSFTLAGMGGAETFSFAAGSTGQQIVATINAASSDTGVTASHTETGLAFRSVATGESAFVEIVVLSEAAGGTFESSLSATRDEGEATTNDLLTKINLTSGTNAVHYDFCEHVGVNLSGFVYHDADNDGVFDSGEEGIGGVTVELLDENGNGTGQFTTTSSAPGLVGFYEFTNLAAGVYGVGESQPDGWIDGKDTAGNRGGTANSSEDWIRGADLPWGHDGVNYNFGEILPSSISGQVHASNDDDCIVDDDDVLLEGVQIDLLDASGNLLLTTFTDADGRYKFDNLAPGEYQVREHQPTGYFDGDEHVGTAGGVISANDLISSVVLTSGTQATEYDFCEHLPSSISGRVHASNDDDCIVDADDILLSGVRIDLLDASGNLLKTTFTDAEGRYSFDGLAPGEYQVLEHGPSEYLDGDEHVGSAGGEILENDKISKIVLIGGTDGIEYDFCEHIGVDLSGWVYHDRNDDGVRDPGEEGIGGVEIELLDATGSPTGVTTTTNSAGFYEFTDLSQGTYGVAEAQPSPWLDGKDTPGNRGGTADTVADEIVGAVLAFGLSGTDYNFGEILPGSISGRVHSDLDGDCVLDDNEDPIAGVTIELYNDSGVKVAETMTDDDGLYEFTGLAPGSYRVVELQPNGYFHGDQHVGSGGGVVLGADDLGAIDLRSDQHFVDYNFCETPPASISGYVFQDGSAIVLPEGTEIDDVDLAALRDGTRTSDDRPLAGVTLELRHGVNGAPIDASQALSGHYAPGPIRTVTDAEGFYHFDGLAPGTYAVYETHPEDLIDGVDTVGTEGGIAVNPHENPNPSVLSLLSENPKDDAIVRIPLAAGQNSIENNFSEVDVKRIVIPPPEPPVLDPPPQVFGDPLHPLAPAPLPVVIAIPETPPYIGSSLMSIAFTWHLSIVDAGSPRSMQFNHQFVHMTGMPLTSISWRGDLSPQTEWTFLQANGAEGDVQPSALFGDPRAIPVTGDWNGDGITDIGVFRDGHWYLDMNGNRRWDEGDMWAFLGDEGDRPVTGDWDGDGKTDIGIFGPIWAGDPRAIERDPGIPDPHNQPNGRWKNVPPVVQDAALKTRAMRLTSKGEVRADLIDHVFAYGDAGDVPLTGDWNGDGIDTIGVFRNGTWHLDTNGDGRLNAEDQEVTMGQAGDKPIVGDWDGDGVDSLGLYRDGKWLLDTNSNYTLDAADQVFESEGTGTPVVGDWNGDGAEQPGLFHGNGDSSVPVTPE